MAVIICGANKVDNARYDGMSISSLKNQLADFLNIPSNAQVTVNGTTVSDMSRIVQSGDTLEFIKQTGEKG